MKPRVKPKTLSGKVALYVSKIRKPKHLHKFHPINTNLIDLLTNSHFYCAKSEELNDPIDLKYNIGKNFILNPTSFIEPILKEYNDKLNKNIMGTSYNNDQTLTRIRITDNTADPDVKIRVCCFSAAQNIHTMWAFYGAGFKGVRLTFDNTFLNTKGDAIILPVYYLRKKYEINSLQDQFMSNFCKLLPWKNEMEWRILSYEKYVQFDIKSLKRIEFGISAQEHEKLLVMQICKKYNIKCTFYQKELINGEFKTKNLNP